MSNTTKNSEPSSKKMSFFYGASMLLFAMAFGIFAPLGHAQAPVSYIHEEGITDVYTTLRVELVRSYFKQWNLPLAEEAETYVEVADQYGIDWRLLPAIAFNESTGGKNKCDVEKASISSGGSQSVFNGHGWGGCKIMFDSYEEAIRIVGKNFAGENPATAYYYADKTFEEKLYAYNSVRPDYKQKIDLVMNQIYSPKYGVEELQRFAQN